MKTFTVPQTDEQTFWNAVAREMSRAYRDAEMEYYEDIETRLVDPLVMQMRRAVVKAARPFARRLRDFDVLFEQIDDILDEIDNDLRDLLM